jgi:hypothetical protein
MKQDWINCPACGGSIELFYGDENFTGGCVNCHTLCLSDHWYETDLYIEDYQSLFVTLEPYEILWIIDPAPLLVCPKCWGCGCGECSGHKLYRDTFAKLVTGNTYKGAHKIFGLDLWLREANGEIVRVVQSGTK